MKIKWQSWYKSKRLSNITQAPCTERRNYFKRKYKNRQDKTETKKRHKPTWKGNNQYMNQKTNINQKSRKEKVHMKKRNVYIRAVIAQNSSASRKNAPNKESFRPNRRVDRDIEGGLFYRRDNIKSSAVT